MSIFEEVGLTWKGQEYTVPADKVMGLIEVIEDSITLEELSSEKVYRVKLSKAYYSALRYSGCADASMEEVYSALFNPESGVHVVDAVNAILVMMIPPERLRQGAGGKKNQESDS